MIGTSDERRGSEMKTCTKCGETKPKTIFGPMRGGVDGLCSQCRPCRAKANLAWNRRNAEQVKTTTALWREGNTEGIKKYNKVYKTRNKGRVLLRAAEWKRKNPGAIRAINIKGKLKSRYGLSTEDYELILDSQDGVCAICRTEDPGHHGRFYIDHCHKTGDIRGLLCSRCNTGLGLFLDNPERLSAAIAYLSSHEAGEVLQEAHR